MDASYDLTSRRGERLYPCHLLPHRSKQSTPAAVVPVGRALINFKQTKIKGEKIREKNSKLINNNKHYMLLPLKTRIN